MFAAALAYALYGVLLKRWSLAVAGWQSTCMQALCALAIVFPAFVATPAPLQSLNTDNAAADAYAGRRHGFGGAAVPVGPRRRRSRPNRCAVMMNLLPVLTALGAVGLLGEPVRLWHVIGGGTALAGVAGAEIFRRPLRRAPAAAPAIVE